MPVLLALPIVWAFNHRFRRGLSVAPPFGSECLTESLTRQIDTGKETVPIVAYESGGQIVLHKITRALGLESEFKKLPPRTVGLEA